jgi:hypothetical protein
LKSYKSNIKKCKTAALKQWTGDVAIKQWTGDVAIKSEVPKAQTRTVEKRKDNECNDTDDYGN